jgi:hypothetical protein
MDKLNLMGQNLGLIFNSRNGRTFAPRNSFTSIKQPSLEWKTQSKQLLHYVLLAFALPGVAHLT